MVVVEQISRRELAILPVVLDGRSQCNDVDGHDRRCRSVAYACNVLRRRTASCVSRLGSGLASIAPVCSGIRAVIALDLAAGSASDSQNSIDLLGGRLRSVVGPIVRLHSPRRVAVRAFGTNHVGKSGATALNGQTVGIDG